MKLDRTALENALKGAANVKIAVIGDMCLDRYITGNMTGISREAPIPIIQIETDVYLPGGAGNTTLNARGLGTTVYPLGVIGDDLSGEIMFKEFHARGINTDYMIREKGRFTHAYTKVYASAFRSKLQQSARFDRANFNTIAKDSEEKVIENLHRLLNIVDALIVADYSEILGAGTISDRVFEEVRSIAKSGKVITIGDSRERVHHMQYFTAVKPNESEVAMALYPDDFQRRPYQQEETAKEFATLLRQKIHCKHVIMTRGEKGALIASEGCEPVNVPTLPAEGEIDVTGAGDCFAATLATGLVLGLDIVAAVELANIAAGITVKKLNTTGIATPQEIRSTYEVFARKN